MIITWLAFSIIILPLAVVFSFLYNFVVIIELMTLMLSLPDCTAQATSSSVAGST